MESINLPFEIKGAVKFNNQAQFNPLKFFKRYFKWFKLFMKIQEHYEIKENLSNHHRGNITANNIVVATHYQ